MHYNIGIIGGCQLGMMMCEQAKKLNVTTIVLDPSPDCPCSSIADKLIVGSFNDVEKLKELGSSCDVLSYEFENVDGKNLLLLNNQFVIPQGIQPLLDSQDRLIEKNNALNHGLPTVEFYPVNNLDDFSKALAKLDYPVVFKTRREGYDGHGQVVINSESDIEKLHPYFEKKIPAIVEKKCDFDYECSIIMIRDKNNIIHFPLSHNIHKDGILDISSVEGFIDKDVEDEIVKKSESFMIDADYYGILTIEYFVKGKEFFFNEMAPRPHNSGHYTIEGCSTNQFLELDKFLLGRELSTPKLLSPTLMKNLLGRDMKNLPQLLKLKSAHLHTYHKSEERPLRKLGHITYTNTTLKDYYEFVNKHITED